MIRFLGICLVCFFAIFSSAQDIGINATGAVPDASAALDVDFTDKGVLIPQIALLNALDMTTIPIPLGIGSSELIYNTATAGVYPNDVYPGFYYCASGRWSRVLTDDWHVGGNIGTNVVSNFVGTRDNVDFFLKRMKSTGCSSGGLLGTSFTNLGTYKSAVLGTGNSALGVNDQFCFGCAFSGTNNTGLGYYSVYGTCNNRSSTVGLGYRANMGTGFVGTVTSGSVGIGFDALLSASENDVIGVGRFALKGNNDFGIAIGDSCVASANVTAIAIGKGINGPVVLGLGYYASRAFGGGFAVGSRSLRSGGVGSSSCIAIGVSALGGNSSISGINNIALGASSLFSITSGTGNIGIGKEAIYSNTSAINNVALGDSSQRTNNGGSSNVSIGVGSLQDGNNHSANTAIGYQAGKSISTGFNNVVIGANASVPSNSGGNQISIGNQLYGINNKLGIGTSGPNVVVDINATDAVLVPKGTTAQRPATPGNGMLRFNTDTARLEYYDGTTWIVL